MPLTVFSLNPLVVNRDASKYYSETVIVGNVLINRVHQVIHRSPASFSLKLNCISTGSRRSAKAENQTQYNTARWPENVDE